jgi:hypothetical protein
VQSSHNTAARGSVLGFIEPDLIEQPARRVSGRLRVVPSSMSANKPNAASYAADRIARTTSSGAAPASTVRSGRDRPQVVGRPAVNALCPDATQDQPTCLLRYISLKF